MGRIVVTEFMSIDGVMEAPGGDDGFVRGAWSFEFDRGDDGNQFKADETFGAEALLLGRKTYEGFAKAWPGRDGEFADKFNTMPKYVVSSTLTDPEWTNTTVLEGSFPDSVRELRDDSAGDITVHGSRRLVQGLIAEDLVDELRLMIHPVILGTGMRLWGDTDASLKFKLTDNRSVGPDGVSVQVYERISS
jgi:dihydrofolate reductase